MNKGHIQCLAVTNEIIEKIVTRWRMIFTLHRQFQIKAGEKKPLVILSKFLHIS